MPISRWSHGDAVAADTRVNPDGTLDISRWTRPQHDGAAAARAGAAALVAQLRGRRKGSTTPRRTSPTLIRADLAFTFDSLARAVARHLGGGARPPLLHAACPARRLREGSEWLEGQGDAREARVLSRSAQTIRRTLDGFWLPEAGLLRSRVLASGETSDEGARHRGDPRGDSHRRGSARTPLGARSAHARHAGEARSAVRAAYPINHDRPRGRGARRWADTPATSYYSGGAYYFSTLGAAEFCFRAAARRHGCARSWVAHGDAFLATVRAFTPASGDLSEQFDQRTGEQTSAKHLAWSYAAFISCVTARRAVRRAMTDRGDRRRRRRRRRGRPRGRAFRQQPRMIFRAIFASPVGSAVIVLVTVLVVVILVTATGRSS